MVKCCGSRLKTLQIDCEIDHRPKMPTTRLMAIAVMPTLLYTLWSKPLVQPLPVAAEHGPVLGT